MPEEQAAPELVPRQQLHRVRLAGLEVEIELLVVLEPFDLNWSVAIQNLAHQNEAHTWRVVNSEQLVWNSFGYLVAALLLTGGQTLANLLHPR